MFRGVDIELDLEDGINEAMAAELIDELRDDDDDIRAEVETLEGIELVPGLALVALIGLAMTTTTGAAVLAAFIFKVFHKGVTIICKGNRVQIKKNNDLPRGSVYLVHCDGTSELRDSLNGEALAGIIKAMVDTHK